MTSERTDHHRGSQRPARWLAALTIGQGVLLAVLVAGGGSAWWGAARVLAVAAVTGALLAGLRHGGAVRGWCALGAGVVGVLAGVGIGAGHLAKGVVSATTVLGLAVLGTGLVLLVAGAVLAVRAVPGWWRLAALPVGLLLAQFVLLPGAVAVYATNVPPTAVRTTPAARGLPYVEVHPVAPDGVRLSGWYVPGRNRAAVVVLHGSGSTRSDVLDQAAVLARHGYGVLLLDARGHGRSGGHAMDFGWYGRQDVTAAVDLLRTRPDVDPDRVGLLGESMGGEEALTAAGADRRIAAVVAEGVTARVPADRTYLPYDLTGLVSRGESWVEYGLCRLLTGAAPPAPLRVAVAATAPRPVLVIAGGAPGEIAAGRGLREAAPTSVRLWEVPDAGHTRALATHPAEWEARVVGLFDRGLAAAGGA